MGIRNTAKAVIISDGRILLNRCYKEPYGAYYCLPGGGQQPYESIEEAVRRECLEETGYTVHPSAFLAFCEDIDEDPDLRAREPDYTHRMYLIFRCELDGAARQMPAEPDSSQLGCEWVELCAVRALRLFPTALRDALPELLSGRSGRYLGCTRIQ